MIYDLEDRTKNFSKEVIIFLKTIKLNQYLGLIIMKQMAQFLLGIFSIKLPLVEKRQGKLNTGLNYWPRRVPNIKIS
jgi:hypothetical protein